LEHLVFARIIVFLFYVRTFAWLPCSLEPALEKRALSQSHLETFRDSLRWGIALHVGPEAISRIDDWIREGDMAPETGIPAAVGGGVYVYAPIEIRVNSG
jgi:hypothetical protein